MHRTDCMNCRKPVYHPPIWGDKNPDNGIMYVGFKMTGGFIYSYSSPTDNHYLIIARTGKHIVATCAPWEELTDIMFDMNALISMKSSF